MRLLSMQVLSDDVDAVCDAVAVTWPGARGVAVGAARRWIGVFLESLQSPGDWEVDAARLARTSRARVLTLLRGAEAWGVAALHDSDGAPLGRIDWQSDGGPAQLELMQVELERWAQHLGDELGLAARYLDGGWADAAAWIESLAEALGVANVERSFESLIEQGDGEVVGWESFRARIDGEWMLLAERRWLAPPIAPMSDSSDEPVPADLDETPHLALSLSRRHVVAGEHLTVSLTLGAGRAAIELVDLTVRLVGVVEHRHELRRFETSLVVAQDGRIEPETPLAVACILDVPVRAVPSASGAPWRVEATASLADGELALAESAFEVLGVQPRLHAPPGPGDEARAEGHVVGDAAVLDDGPALVVRRRDAPAVRVRYVGGLYRVEAGYEGEGDEILEITGGGGRFARVREPDAHGHTALELAVRPAAQIDLERVASLLGNEEFVAEVLDDELGLSGLARWDHVHRRVLATFALAVCSGRLALHPWVELVLEHQISAEASFEADQRGGVALPEEDPQASALLSAFAELSDPLGDGPIEARLARSDAPAAAAASPAREPLTEDTDGVVARAEALLEEERADEAIALIDQAITEFHLDARLYALKGSAYMSMGFDMRARYTDQVDYFEWRYPEPYRARAQALRRAAERALRLAVWLDPTPEAAANLARTLKHPLDALGAWEVALSLSPHERAFRIGMAEAIVRAEGADPQAAITILESLEAPGADADEEAWLQWARICRRLALARLRQSLRGGEPSYFHFGLVGDPTPVVPSGPLEPLREAVARLAGLEGAARDAATLWLDGHLRALVPALEACDADAGLGLDAAARLADIAHGYSIEPLGRLAGAIALRGWRRDEVASHLVARARVLQIVYLPGDADAVLERAEALSSRALLGVLETRLDILRARGEQAAARALEARIVRIAPERHEQARQVFGDAIELGELDRAEALLQFYLFQCAHEPGVASLAVEQAARLSEVYLVMGDPQAALRPVEWCLFVLGDALDEGQRDALRARLAQSLEQSSLNWQGPWEDEPERLARDAPSDEDDADTDTDDDEDEEGDVDEALSTELDVVEDDDEDDDDDGDEG